MYVWICIVTPKNIWIFFFVLYVSHLNFEIMTSSPPIKLNWTLPCALTSLKIDLAVNSLLQTPLTIKILLLLGQFFLKIIFGYLQYKLGIFSEQGCVRKISI